MIDEKMTLIRISNEFLMRLRIHHMGFFDPIRKVGKDKRKPLITGFAARLWYFFNVSKLKVKH